MPDSNKKDHRKDILERDTDTQDKSGKQVKIDEMMAPKESQPDLKKLMDIVTRLGKKVNNLASKEYIENALDARLEGLVIEDFVASSLKTLKKDLSDEIKKDMDKVYEQIRSVKSKIKEAHTEIEHLKISESEMKVKIQKVNEENEKLRNRNKELNEKITNNHDRVRYNEHQVNELEQYTRRNSIRIYEMDDTNKNETPKDT
jgi:uncharacterized coiled-coil DUF342 family protein